MQKLQRASRLLTPTLSSFLKLLSYNSSTAFFHYFIFAYILQSHLNFTMDHEKFRYLLSRHELLFDKNAMIYTGFPSKDRIFFFLKKTWT